MHHRPFLLTSIAIVSLAASATVAAAQSSQPAASAQPHKVLAQLPADSVERARRYAIWLMSARSDSLFANTDSVVKVQLGSASAFDQMSADLAIRAGSEDRLIEERWVNRQGKRQYWRTSKYSTSEEPIILRLVILPTGKLAGLGMNPVSQAPPIDP
jgi:hypothetical protein